MQWLRVPFRRERRSDETVVLRQYRNSMPVIIVEFHRQRVEIGLLTFAALSLRNNSHPVLFQKPRKCNLSSGHAMLDANSLKYRVARSPALCKWGICDKWNAFLAQVVQHFRLL